jgi:5S rRNA maturation endonuclease (ribonuclease M5)
MARPRDFNDILSRIPGTKQSGNHWAAPCPLPGHKTPQGHLTLRDTGDKSLIICQGGRHTYEDICQWLDFDSLTYSHNGKGAEAKILATYDYTDANGKLLYQVVRFEPKEFKQRRPDGNGRWVWNLDGVNPLLYRLPEVSKAIAEGQIVYVCEGEKDTDALRKKGLTATTNSGGAGKWRPEYTRVLVGASVVILPDKDAAGQRHAAKVATCLYGRARSIKIVELSDKGGYQVKDVTDWLAAGGTVAELERLASETPEWKPKETVTTKKAKDTEGEELRESSFLTLDHALYEEIVSDGHVAFIEYNTISGESRTVTHIMQGETKVIPQQGEELKLGAIKLPSGVTEYGDTLSLLREVETHIFIYLDVSDAFRKFAAYYILLSWLYDKFSTLPYIRAIGDTGCGKSRLLDVCGSLCYKPTLVSGCITPAPIYRMLKRWNGTMILDEADLQNSDEYSEVVKILNCGFERGRPVIRATKDNPDKLQFLPTFGPKVFATRRRFKDPALEARCLTEIMQETTRDDIPSTLTNSFYKEQEALRNKLLLFRLRNYALINPEETVTLNFQGIEPRLKQISASFASLFAGQPEVLSDYQAFIQHHQRELIEQRAATQIGQVVEKLFALTESVTNVTNVTSVTGEELIPISSKDIAEPLNMTPQAVGQILKTLGLHTKVHKVEGASKRCIVYDSVKLDTLKRRYIPSEDDQVTLVTTVTTVTGLNANDDIPDHPHEPCHNCGKGQVKKVTQ